MKGTWNLFRETVNRHNNKLLCLWGLSMSIGFGYIYYMQKQGKDFRSKPIIIILKATPTFPPCSTT